MKYCSGNIKNHCVLAGLVALLVTGYVSAADKKLSPAQQLRSTSPSHSVRVPVKVPPPFVQLNAAKQATNKPVKKSAGIKPVSSFAVKKKPPGNRGLSPINSISPPITPSGLIPAVHLPVQVSPALPAPPVRQVQPVAPAVLNPRTGGISTRSPANKRTTSPTRGHRSGTGSAPGHSFSLLPLGQPGTGSVGQGRTDKHQTTNSSPASQHTGKTFGFVPGSTTGSQYSSPSRPNREGVTSPVAGSRDTNASRQPESGGSTADSGSIGPVTEVRVPNGDGTTTAYSPDGSTRSFTSNSGSSGMVTDFNDDGSITLNIPGGGSRTYNNDGSVTTTTFDGSSVTQNVDGSTTYTSATGATETYNTDGSMSRTQPDGSSEVVYPDGARTVTRSDGVVETYAADGSMSGITSVTEEDGSGSVSFPDGSRTEYDSDKNSTYYSADGTTTTTTTYADGSEEVEYSNGTVRETTPDGTRITHYPDGTVIEEAGGETIIHGADGSETFENSPGDSANRNIKTAVRYDADGTVTETYDDGTGAHTSRRKLGADGSRSQGDQGTTSQQSVGSSTGKDTKRDKNTKHTNDNGDTDDEAKSDSGDGSGDDNNSDNDSASSDDNADSNDDSADSGDDSSSDDNSGDDKGSSDEARNGFESGRGGDGGPEAAAKTTVDDRVARMKGEKRDPESPEDSEQGNGGSAPGSVSQPGPDGGHRGSPLARPSTEGHQSTVNVVVPTVKSRASVGGGDCFREAGCDNAPTGDFRLDPINRDPVTNPGGH